MSTQTECGRIIYDSEHGHVCTCSQSGIYFDSDGNAYEEYEHTVRVDRDTEPTNSGSWFYVCERCGAGAWSGC